MIRSRAAAATILTMATVVPLASCSPEPDEPEQAQRISLEAARQMPREPLLSPDTEDAKWIVAADGRAIDFGTGDEPPMLTLACELRATPPRLRIVRHVPARPGKKALFPVIGNGTISRFKLDAGLHDGEWRWEGVVSASDPMLDVFTGPRELEATLPGGGSLLIAGSRIPGEFVNWCRAGGRVQRAETEERAEAEAESDASSR